MNWQLIGRVLRLGFLLRVPLLTLVSLAALGPVSSHSSLLDNLFDAGRHAGDTTMISFAAFLLAFTAIATLNLTLLYGSDRLDEHSTVQMSQRRPLLTFVLGSGAAVIFVASVVARTENSVITTTLAAIAGALLAFSLVIITKVVQLALTDPATTPHPPPFLIFPAYVVRWAERKFDDLYCWSSPGNRRLKTTFNSLSQWPLRILRSAGQGYLIDLNPSAGTLLKLRSGHVFTLTLSLIAFAVYLVIGLTKRHITAAPAFVPALAYLLLFCIVACWCLAALTFFFDRYRFPLFAAVVCLALVTAQAPKSDHFFRVERKDLSTIRFLSPAAYFSSRARLVNHERLIFIVTPGGGIQAAAWTAEVLAKLDERMPDDRFRKAVGAISSVSGGSLGAMIYLASFTGQVPRHDVIANSRVSALDEVAWGWTFADFWRGVAPWFGNRTIDRGLALEEKWAAVNSLRKDGADTLLSDWAARGSDMPAIIFNSMLVERGQHLIFSSSHFPRPDRSRGIANFYELYPGHARGYDVRVNTAARLSASFPYVAPASRSDLESMYIGDYHIVDGGYYDNYGVDSLIGWLGEAMEVGGGNEKVKDILILTIHHFSAGDPPESSVRGWGFQLFAPLSGLLSMWNAAPAQRDANEFRLFAEGMRGSAGRKVWIVNISYRGKTKLCARAPLSWKLSESQQRCIDDAWGIVLSEQADDLSCLEEYLSGQDAPKCQYPIKTLQPLQ